MKPRSVRIQRYQKATDPKRWEKTIQAFETSDRQAFPEPGGIVFVGSSTFAFWITLEEDMAPLPVIRRGFGGSTINDSVYYAKRIVVPYKPRMVVLYAGDNDVAFKVERRVGEHAAQECLEDFTAFTRTVHDALPATHVYFISIKPSIARWDMWPVMRDANALIQGFTTRDDREHYIDIVPVMLDEAGMPNNELFAPDMLHLEEEGYKRWTGVIKPIVFGAYSHLTTLHTGKET